MATSPQFITCRLFVIVLSKILQVQAWSEATIRAVEASHSGLRLFRIQDSLQKTSSRAGKVVPTIKTTPRARNSKSMAMAKKNHRMLQKSLQTELLFMYGLCCASLRYACCFLAISTEAKGMRDKHDVG